MERDMDLVREVLIRVESGEIHLQDVVEIKPYTVEQVRYHIRYLHKYGFIEGTTKSRDGLKTLRYVSVIDLTEKGHDFMSATRDKKIWNRAKSLVLEKGLPMTFEILIKYALLAAQGL